MNNKSAQIFQTDNRNRWQKVKWVSRISLFVISLAVAVVSITLYKESKENVNIPLETRAIKKVLKGDIPSYRQSKLGRQYRGMRMFINRNGQRVRAADKKIQF